MQKTDQELVAERSWFHSIDFGAFASSGRFKPGGPQNVTLYGVFEFLKALKLDEASVLDIGCSDGVSAYGAAGLGARDVHAADTFNSPTFHLARRLLGLEQRVRYWPKHQIGAFNKIFEPKSFDCIVCAGVFYHMLYPMQSFIEPRKLLRDGGYLILETPFIDDRKDAALVFNGTDAVVNEPYTYFVPTRAALMGMANLVGFKIIAERILLEPRRITFLLQASDRASLIEDAATPPFIVQMLKRDICDDEFRFRNLEAAPAAPARISLASTSLAAHRKIDSRKEKVSFPYHPPLERPTFGKTRFENADGNTKVL